ncbi:MAG: ribosome biogenesis GTP-binding protein YihA/YsxC [Bryobacterales bacterium]
MPVELVVSAMLGSQFPRDGLPEIAFVGRSNVGKSSLLNTLLLRGEKRSAGEAPLNRSQLAHTSRTPGRTQAINFYRIDQAFYFVDLPGYGFAKVPKKVMDDWKRLADSYLSGRPQLKLVVLIVDSRHGPTALDLQMKEWLGVNQKQFLAVASKADKLKASERVRTLRALEKDFESPLAFSSKTGEGVAALWRGIQDSLNQ